MFLKKIFFILFVPLTLWAESEIKSFTEASLVISTMPEAKVSLKQTFVFPFLQGESFLTENNNVKTDFILELSPISLNVLTNAIWTPIAFFELSAGSLLGSGWNVNLFGTDIYGIGIHKRGTDGKGEIEGKTFEGAFAKVNGGAALQFDLFAIFPGDWNHILFRTYHEINYKAFSNAKNEETWVFENENRENRNGFNYYASYVLGYQMPIRLNLLGLMAEMDLFLYNTPNRNDWGDNIGRWTFSLIGNVEITPRFNTAIIVQTRTKRNYDDESLFYQDRKINGANPQRLEFYRVALILNFKIKG